MVTVVNYAIRKNADNEQFIALILQGELELIKSKKTGKYYATSRTTSIVSTFDEAIAKQMIGKTLPGTIAKSPCEPYEYTIPETGEIIQLNYRYSYVAEDTLEEQSEECEELVADEISMRNTFSNNGTLALAN